MRYWTKRGTYDRGSVLEACLRYDRQVQRRQIASKDVLEYNTRTTPHACCNRMVVSLRNW